ncbi:hypothetical protein ACKWTF_014343 [Chironomus riparius]
MIDLCEFDKDLKLISYRKNTKFSGLVMLTRIFKVVFFRLYDFMKHLKPDKLIFEDEQLTLLNLLYGSNFWFCFRTAKQGKKITKNMKTFVICILSQILNEFDKIDQKT